MKDSDYFSAGRPAFAARRLAAPLLLCGSLLGTPALQAQDTGDPVFDLDPLEVRAIADGQRRALIEQKDSKNFINMISADAIGRFPDANIAEALQRLPGIGIERDQGEGRFINVRGAPKEFSSVTIDGVNVPSSDADTRAIALDIFASDFASEVEVTKSIRPDQDADSIAGAVAVRSPSALAVGHRRVLGSLATSYNDNGGTNDSRASMLFSDVLGSSGQLGIVLGFNYSKTRREVDNVEHEGWDLFTLDSGREVWSFEETNFKDYETRRERFGFNAALEFRPNENTLLYLRGFASKFEDDEFRYRLRIHWSDGDLVDAATGDGFGELEKPRVSFQFRHRIKTDETRSLSTGGIHQFNGIRWDYNLAYSVAEQYYPRRDELLYRKRVPSISYDFRDNPKQPEISLFSTNEHLQTDDYDFREYSRRVSDTDESELSAASNLRMEGELFGQPARHSFGIKLRNRDKEKDANRFRDRSSAADPGATLTSFLRDTEARNFSYVLGRKHQPALVQAYYDSVRPNAPQRRVTDGILSDFEVDEDIYAGYAMSEFNVGAVEFIAGVRVERTRTSALAYTFNDATGEIGQQTAKNTYTNWFPGLHLRNELLHNVILRASINRAISRPTFSSLAPFREDDPDSRTLELGNPDLNPTLSTNYDLSLEYYLNDSGLVSVALFYKDLKDYIFVSRFSDTLSLDGMPVNYRITQPLNSPDGEIKGIELNYLQTLSFLPQPFDGFGIFANYTYSKSKADLPDGSASIQLPGNSKHSSNLGVYYETDRLSVQLSYNHRSDYIQEVDSIGGRDYDVFWGGRGQFDLTASYQLTSNFEVFAEFTNLTNTKGLRYVGVPERVLEYEEFGWWVTFGTRFNF